MLYLIVLTIGFLSAWQFLANSTLSLKIGLGKTTLINSFIVLAGALLFYLWEISKRQDNPWNLAWGYPWYQYIGGLCGLSVIIGSAYVMPRLGSAMTVALFVLAQLTSGVIFDHFGILGITQHPINIAKIMGILCLAAGTILIRL